jgi:hypothetical protein
MLLWASFMPRQDVEGESAASSIRRRAIGRATQRSREEKMTMSNNTHETARTELVQGAGLRDASLCHAVGRNRCSSWC